MATDYGFCPICGAPGVERERRPNGNDACQQGHAYPSSKALGVRPTKAMQMIPLYAFATRIGATVDLTRKPDGVWTCTLRHTDMMKDSRLHAPAGTGRGPREAATHLAGLIRGPALSWTAAWEGRSSAFRKDCL